MRLLAVVVALAGASAAFGQDEYRRQLREAQAHLQQEELEEAIAVLQQAREVAPDDTARARVDNALGWAFFRTGDLPRAKSNLLAAQKAVEDEPTSELARTVSNNLGIVLFSDGELDLARQQLESPASRDSAVAQRYLPLIDAQQRVEAVNERVRDGIVARLNGKFDQAIESYDAALAESPDDVRALEYKGYALFRLKRYDEAEQYLLKARGMAPERLTIVVNLMKVHCARGDAPAAKNVFTEAPEAVRAEKSTFAGDGELRTVCGESLSSILN